MNKKKLIVLAVVVALAAVATFFKVDVSGFLANVAAIEKQVTPMIEDAPATPATPPAE